jgi:hypothetical protein
METGELVLQVGAVLNFMGNVCVGGDATETLSTLEQITVLEAAMGVLKAKQSAEMLAAMMANSMRRDWR